MGMNPELPGVNMYITTCLHGVDLRFTPRCYLCKPWPDDSPVWKVASPGHVHEGEWCAMCVEAGGEARERTLRERGWVDQYEFETATAMSHGEGMAEARAPLDVDRLADTLMLIHGSIVPLPNRCTPREYAAVIAREYAALEEPTA
jgi:hypothetical protein